MKKQDVGWYAIVSVIVIANEIALKYGAQVIVFPVTMILFAVFILYKGNKNDE